MPQTVIRRLARERRWEEIELALEDERIERSALLHQRRLREPAPLPQVRLSNLAVVREQVRLRRARLQSEALPSRQREAEAVELGVLLERALARHPRQPELAQSLFELWVGPLDRPQQAAELAGRWLLRDRRQVEAWSIRRRQARCDALRPQCLRPRSP